MSAIREFLKYGMYGKSSWYIAYCPLYGRCPLFGVSAKRGSTVYKKALYVIICYTLSYCNHNKSRCDYPRISENYIWRWFDEK